MQLMQSESLRNAKTRLSKALLTDWDGGRAESVRVSRSHMARSSVEHSVEREGAEGAKGPGIHAVGLGREDPRDPESPAILRVYISPWFFQSALFEKAGVPSEVDGVSVKKVLAAPATLHQLPSCGASRQRPARGGVSVGHFDITAGTIGCYVRSRKADEDRKVFLLSNNHVLANLNSASVGDAILQPGPEDGGRISDKIAELYRFERIRIGGDTPNLVDAAIACVDDRSLIDTDICRIGAISAAENAIEGQPVRMYGRTTGLSEGFVTDESLNVNVKMDPNDSSVVAQFVDQIRIAPVDGHETFGLSGDSGSLVVDAEEPTAVGLYFAGPRDGSYGIANPIETVLDTLDISML